MLRVREQTIDEAPIDALYAYGYRGPWLGDDIDKFSTEKAEAAPSWWGSLLTGVSTTVETASDIWGNISQVLPTGAPAPQRPGTITMPPIVAPRFPAPRAPSPGLIAGIGTGTLLLGGAALFLLMRRR